WSSIGTCYRTISRALSTAVVLGVAKRKCWPYLSLVVAFRAIRYEDKGYFSIGTLTNGSKDEVGLTWGQIWSCEAVDYLSNFYFMPTIGFQELAR
ncbi:hypothetical protein KI387_043724, partial [Taxus chinensis]